MDKENHPSQDRCKHADNNHIVCDHAKGKVPIIKGRNESKPHDQTKEKLERQKKMGKLDPNATKPKNKLKILKGWIYREAMNIREMGS